MNGLVRVLALVLVYGLSRAGQLQAQSPVSFPTPDRGIVQGDMYGSGNCAVVAHGGYSQRARWEKQARTLAAAGFRVIAFDTRAEAELKQTGKETECLYDPAWKGLPSRKSSSSSMVRRTASWSLIRLKASA